MTVRFFDFLAGVGGMRLGLELAGWKCVGSCEKDRYCKITYKANFPLEDEYFWDDAADLDTASLPDFDVLVSGFPCQPWSGAGKKLGFDDARGLLFFEIARVLRDRRPQAFLLENVPGLLSEPFRDAYNLILRVLRELGYMVSVSTLNSRDFGVRQNRERVFFVGIRADGFQATEWFSWPKGPGPGPGLSETLDPDPPKKYDLSPRMVKTLLTHLARNRAKGNMWGSTLISKDGIQTPTISANYHKGPGGSGRPMLVDFHGSKTQEPTDDASPIRANSGHQQVLLTFDIINKDQDRTVRDADLFASIITRMTGRGVAVSTTNPRNAYADRKYHFTENMRALKAQSKGGTNEPLVLQVERYDLRQFQDGTPTLTGNSGGYDVPLILRISNPRVNMVRDDAPTLKSSDYASFENIVYDPKIVRVVSNDRVKPVRDEAPTLMSAHGNASAENAVMQGVRLRRLTPRECFRLQGFPDSYRVEDIGVSDHQLYIQAGNTVTVPVITALGKAMESRL